MSDANTLRIVRTFPCSRARLWEAWTDWSTALAWWGPVDWPTVDIDADLREGGEWRAELQSASGESLHQAGRFLEITPQSRLSFTFRWVSDNHEDGPGVETRVSVDLTEVTEGTRMEFVQTELASAESVTGHTDGWNSTFDRLTKHIEGSK